MFGARKGEYELPADAIPTRCNSCGMGMVWVTTGKGKAMPLSVDTIEVRDGIRFALSHFSDCKDAKEWSKKYASTHEIQRRATAVSRRTRVGVFRRA